MVEIVSPKGFTYRPILTPVGFDILSATEEDLAHYGLPSRSRSPGFAEAYSKIFGQGGKKARSIDSPLEFRPDIRCRRPEKTESGADTAIMSTNWCGAVTTAAQGKMFETLTCGFEIPRVEAPPSLPDGQTSYCAMWGGLDGAETVDVVQGGVLCTATSAAQNYSAWYEWYPDSMVIVSGLKVSPGDVILVWIVIAGTTPGNQSAVVTIYNTTSNTDVSYTITPPPGIVFQGNTAEWVVERPAINGVNSILANYGSMTLDTCDALYSQYWYDQKAYGPGDGQLWYMYNDNYSTMISKSYLIERYTVQCAYL
jgi:hypothetical protein